MSEIEDLITRREELEVEFDRAVFEKSFLDERLDRMARELDDLRIEIAVGEMMND